MAGIRRGYIYLVSLVSLQALTWSLISLLHNIFVYGRGTGAVLETESLSWQIAIIIVTLPVFLVHWLWGQRLTRRHADEQTAWVRSLYLYAIIASFLVPIISNSLGLLQTLFQLLLKVETSRYSFIRLSAGNAIVYHLIAITVLALFWFYHYHLVRERPHLAPNHLKLARSWYLFSFATVGLTMMSIAAISLLRWLLLQIGETAVIHSLNTLATDLAQLFLGAGLWVLFWQQAQHLFSTEAESTVRKFYLYLIIFVTALTAVAAATGIFAGILRRLLGLAAEGDIREPISFIAITAPLWFYHAQVLQRDIRASQEQPKQATIRRLYWYLIAAIGLAAFLVGLGGNISVLLRSLSDAFLTELREQLAWFTAALVAGLPVWLIPWRQAQTAAALPGEQGHDEREAIVRKIYLYFYIFVATMTVLASAIYIVYRLVSLILGVENSQLSNDLPHAIAYGLMGVAVWLYHGAALRHDSRLTDVPVWPDSLRVAVVDKEDGRLGQPLLTALQQALPFATLQAVGFPAVTTNSQPPETVIAEAELIVSPWPLLPDDDTYTTAVAHSPARKLLIPAPQAGWEWVGVDAWDLENIIDETVQASRQIAAGGVVKRHRTSIGTILSIVAGVLGLFILMSILLSSFFELIF